MKFSFHKIKFYDGRHKPFDKSYHLIYRNTYLILMIPFQLCYVSQVSVNCSPIAKRISSIAHLYHFLLFGNQLSSCSNVDAILVFSLPNICLPEKNYYYNWLKMLSALICLPLAKGMEYLTEQGIIHRDVALRWLSLFNIFPLKGLSHENGYQ